MDFRRPQLPAMTAYSIFSAQSRVRQGAFL